jgi:oligo-1,6-glucosidase
MAYAFEGVDIARPEGYNLLHFKEVFSRWDSAFAIMAVINISRQPRPGQVITGFGNDSAAYRFRLKCLLRLL